MTDAFPGRNPLTRREFLKRGALGAAAASVLSGCSGLGAQSKGDEPIELDAYGPPSCVGHLHGIPLRTLGKTGRVVPILGFGGSGFIEGPKTDAVVDLIHKAHAAGLRYFDTARTYKNGRSERNFGRALANLDRDSYYLNTKIFSRGFDQAMRDIEDSLQALNVKAVDCLMLHGVESKADIEQIFSKEGALAALTLAREMELTKYIGVSGHANPESLEAALNAFDFDTVMMAINPADHRHLAFEQRCYKKAYDQDIGVINMKSFGGLGGKTLRTLGGVFEPEELLRYSWSLRGNMTVVNINSESDLASCVAAAKNFAPIFRAQKAEMEKRIESLELIDCMNYRKAYA